MSKEKTLKIWLDGAENARETAKDMFGKLMSISDELMVKYFELLTDADLGLVRRMHPKEAKMELAGGLVRQFHGIGAAEDAREHFESVFARKGVPDDIQIFPFEPGLNLAGVLLKTGLAPSKNEVRRLIRQNAVSFEGSPLTDESWPLERGVLKVGKRRFLKIV